jgi:hypothetical protein
VLWAATGGQRGVIGAASMVVVPTAVPGPQVQVKTGGCVVPSTYPGAAQESYSMRNRTATNVSIKATGSSGGRTDAIIARVDDTGLTGIHPSDVQSYDYAKIQVIEGVSSGLTEVDALNLAYPAVLLAKVTLPASTGTVTKAMITDLRHIAMSRKDTTRLVRPLINADDTGYKLELNAAASYEVFPNVDNAGGDGKWMVDIPKWATRMQITGEWLSVNVPPDSGYGYFAISYGPNAFNAAPDHQTQSYGWNADEKSTGYCQDFKVADEVPIPSAWRGTRQPFVFRGKRGDNTRTGKLYMTGTSGVILDIEWLERPDTDLQAD